MVVLVVSAFVEQERVLVLFVGLCLIEHGEYLVETVVDLAMQPRHLYNDAVVRQTADEGVGQAMGHDVAVVVLRFVLHIEHRLLNVAHLMPQNIYRHHRQAVAFVVDIALVFVLYAKVLTEAKRLRGNPRFLNLYQHLLFLAVRLPDPCCEVHAIHREVAASLAGVLMGTRLHAQHILLQQSRQNDTCHADIFKQILENHIVNRICYFHRHSFLLFVAKIRTYTESAKYFKAFLRRHLSIESTYKEHKVSKKQNDVG